MQETPFRFLDQKDLPGEGTGYPLQYSQASIVAQLVKNLQCGRPGLDPWVGKIPWRRKGYPLQYSGLENSMDYIVHRVVNSWTWLSDFHWNKDGLSVCDQACRGLNLVFKVLGMNEDSRSKKISDCSLAHLCLDPTTKRHAKPSLFFFLQYGWIHPSFPLFHCHPHLDIYDSTVDFQRACCSSECPCEIYRLQIKYSMFQQIWEMLG